MYDLSGKIKQYFANKEEKKQISKKEICILLILFGILFMVVRMPTKLNGRMTEKSQITSQENLKKVDESQMKNVQLFEYLQELSKRTEQVLGRMDGVGRVTVMLTLRNDGQINVEKDVEMQSDTENTKDASGGDQQQIQEDRKESTCYYEDASGKEIPIVVRTDMPMVEGIFVVCEGGDDTQVKLQILNACQALFGIEAHKIVIVKGNTSERSAE